MGTDDPVWKMNPYFRLRDAFIKNTGEIIMRYESNMESIRTHTVPQWYEDDKFGIFIHWGLYSVPAYAPHTWALGDVPADEKWFTNNPYAEWYKNSIRIGRGPAWEYHKETYGEDFPYEGFADMWKAEKWNPAEWAQLFKAAGARFVVPTTKHHDGFCLWDSAYTDYNTKKHGPGRDIIDELSTAVRGEGLRFGVYYSGIIDWSFVHEPVLSDYEVDHPYNVSYAYSDYAYNQMMELIDKYKPSVLWNDIGWPEKGLQDLPYLFAHYYNTVPEGVVNDRWSNVWCDYTTREYHKGAKNAERKWECCRGLGLSFGYNRIEDESLTIAPNALVKLLVDTVAYGGNLLLNVGPKADGTIPEIQRNRLLFLGSWLKKNGEAIYGTRKFTRPCDMAESGETIYFTRKDDAVYAIVTDLKLGCSSVKIRGFGACVDRAAALDGRSIQTVRKGDDLILGLSGIEENTAAVAIRFPVV